jgi:hypothetical protein
MADNIANTVALAKYAKVIGCSVSVMLCAIPRLTVPAFLTPGQTHLSYSASWAASENIGYLDCDHHLTTTSSTRLHTDQLDLGIGIAQVTNSELSEILCCWLVESGGVLVCKWPRDLLQQSIQLGVLRKDGSILTGTFGRTCAGTS